jgi:hypothetical protein
LESTKIAQARIAYGGRGQITDVQQPRYGQQVLDISCPGEFGHDPGALHLSPGNIVLAQSGDGPAVTRPMLPPFPLPGTVIARRPKLPPGAALTYQIV